MTEEQAVQLVSKRFTDNWPAASVAIGLPGLGSSAVPIALDNEGEPAGDYQASCSLVHTTTLQITMGSPGTRKIEVKGYVMVKFWVPSDQGRKWASKMATAARGIFNGVNLPSPINGDEPVTLLAGATKEIGDDGRWFMQVVSFPFRYYDLM